MIKKKEKVFVKKVEYVWGFNIVFMVLGVVIIVFSFLFAAYDGISSNLSYLIVLGLGLFSCLLGLFLARVCAIVTWEEKE